jgi:hypothetical protein
MRAMQSDGLVLNMKDLVGLINIYFQVTPSAAWTSLLHSSGLFAWILNKVVENEVSLSFLCDSWV